MNQALLWLMLVLLTFEAKASEWESFIDDVEDIQVDDIQEAINDSSSYIFPTNNDEFFTSENNTASRYVKDYGTFDYIIIGGGTAGGVLANRLTEGPFTVLVIEAGEPEPKWTSILGVTLYSLYSHWSWGYNTTTQNTSCFASNSHQCFYPRGKVLGGCSSINGGMYVRGNKKDYDEWEQMGNPGWAYEDCLPYFKKSEKANIANDLIDEEYHGFNGMQIINVPPDTEGLTDKLVSAATSLGNEEIDFNGATQHGIGRMQFYLDNNTRTSTASAYIRPAMNRMNLKITLKSLATKIITSKLKRKALGVEFVKNGQKYVAKARKEVIVSAGSINSPQVLMLSGIGPAAELEKHNIPVVADLPVGEHLLDHTLFSALCFRTNQVFYSSNLAENLNLWAEGKRPLVAMVHLIGFPTNKTEYIITSANPDMGSGLLFKEEYANAFKVLNSQTDFCATTILLKPKSFGRVTLQSNDPRDFPLIDTNYFSNPEDLEALYEGIQEVLKLNETEVFREWNATLIEIAMPDCDDSYERLSKDWWFCAFRSVGSTIYHPVATTRMGPNPTTSVVDSELKVHGFKNLRVVDAGVMPAQIAGHTHAAVIMIAEKIADVIKRDWLKL
ncbi:glucose dehydrogenase [FAD, quinone]-like [Anthonomus grandis grandis]|uniref:glucose dehydrogenase [FAD, quinone]-like n=1 Tax=Anthonomus grandis grandis TaxID=2921223 RepID=UPI00216611A7|nr:glucose dehydrogenase [FAD, quinone]-like [Anthonomus grandis grandis]